MPETEVAITELLEIDPERVDAVTSPANGTEWLMLKAIDDSQTVTDTDGVLAELAKDDGGDDDSGDDGDSKDCSTCDGSGKIMDGNRKCPDCGGSGDASKAIKPRVGETMEEFQARKAGSAASGEPVPVLDDCPTCKGTGEIKDGTADGKTCPDCDGSGNDAKVPQDDSLNTVDADGGSITEGAGGRETVDKATDEDIEKKNVDPNVGGGVDRDKLKGGDFAGKNRSFPIVTPGDVSDAASSIGRAGADNYSADQLKSNIIAIAKRKGASFVAQLPKAWTDGDASKADLSGSMYSAPNPALADPVSQGTDPAADDDSTDDGSPGSPTWEAADAQTATDAAMALMTAAELIRTFAQREQTEVAVGKGNDIFDSYAATEALCGVSQALGIMSQLAFHEGLEAAKSLAEDETIEKAGRRLAGKTVAALAAARDKAKDLADHIGGVLGVDDPANKADSANKSIDVDMDELSKEIENMTTDELTKVLDAREEKLVGILAEALKPPAPEDKKVKKAKPVAAEADDDEVTDEAEKAEADEESDEVAEPAEKAAEPVELTPEVTEANEAAAAAKKEAKRLKKAAEEAAKTAALTKSIEEHLAKVVEQNEVLNATVETLRGELDGVKKMAAPNPIVRTAPPGAQDVAKAKDELELRLAQAERIYRTTADPDIRTAKREEAKELAKQMAEISQ